MIGKPENGDGHKDSEDKPLANGDDILPDGELDEIESDLDFAGDQAGNSDEDKVPQYVKNLGPHQFKPGQSGNPNGRPKGTVSITKRIRQLLKSGISNRDLVDALAKAAIKHAVKGDHRYFKEIIDRIDGKIPDIVADGNLKITVEYVEQPVIPQDTDDDNDRCFPETE